MESESEVSNYSGAEVKEFLKRQQMQDRQQQTAAGGAEQEMIYSNQRMMNPQ